MPGRYNTGDDTDLIARIKDLENRLSRLERTPQAGNAAVNNGDFTITGGAFIVRRPGDAGGGDEQEGLIAMGSQISYNGEEGMSFQVVRSKSVKGKNFFVGGDSVDGNPSMVFSTVDGEVANPTLNFPTFNIYDKSGDVLISDSDNARRGFDDPRFQTPWFDPSAYKVTTSGSFSAIAECEWYQYHPHLRMRLLCQNGAGTSSELRVTDLSSSAIIKLVTQGSTFAFVDLVLNRSDMSNGDTPNGNTETLLLEHRRTAGANNVQTLVVSMVGIDLSWFNPF